MNVFLGSSPIGWVISIVGVVMFTVLTAWDVQKISTATRRGARLDGEGVRSSARSHLYLDFINIFLFLLRLFGGRRN